MIQDIRYTRGLNEFGGGRPATLEQRYERGINDGPRAPLYRVSPDRLTMAAIEDPNGPFTGCQNDTALSFYMGKLSLSWAMRGFVSGVAIGALGTAAALYFLNKAK